ncbi:hypothetical protein QCD60_26030 [Pokkaliibacter sp. MBI-7]|uniref:DUF4124 domain-containing protein n=1 Tax=Pokkaliibacter sp. MBI-7 TaxID=3040600 RepID=UPI0024476975|nr:DUF4124 domain-containing protein [Pokkaliibacter sp. MBI-7]MDH2435995.1 hypothetical protein [Pokkaliibacter sp. MBI-7]
MVKYLLVVAALSVAPAASADIYFCMVDGVKTFTDKACADGVKLSEPEDQPAPDMASAATAPSAGSAQNDAVIEQLNDQLANNPPAAGGLPNAFEAQAQHMKRLADSHRVENGMTPYWVARAWGEPTNKSTLSTADDIVENWQWEDSSGAIIHEVMFMNGVLFSFQ